MNAEELRASQAPLKQQYKVDPQSAQWVLKADGKLRQLSLSVQITSGHSKSEVGLHPATGGSGKEACSGNMLLESLGACAGVTLTAVATALGITLHKGGGHVEGDLDFRGTLGVSKEVPVGFSNIRLRFEVESDATQEQLQSLLKLTERYCVIFQTLRNPPPINVSLNP